MVQHWAAKVQLRNMLPLLTCDSKLTVYQITCVSYFSGMPSAIMHMSIGTLGKAPWQNVI